MCKKAISKAVKVSSFGLIDMDKMLKPPSAPEMPSAPDSAPTAQDPAALAARDDEKRRRLAASGQGSTVLTGSLGLSGAAPTAKKTVLGA
jgi:hypothetical protein